MAHSFNFIGGQQPCRHWTANVYEPYGHLRTHECFGPWDGRPRPACSASVTFCLNCHKDHHEDGWQTCGQTPGAAAGDGGGDE
jgi:hypothetical protein